MAVSYSECRSQFRDRAAAAGAELQRWVIDSEKDLTIDAAFLGEAAAPFTIVISSGLHGVEGPLGSAIQQHWLQADASKLPNDVRVVLLHGLNPFGFEFGRRANEDNVDLNRAFFDSDQRPETDPLCQRLDRLLSPAQASLPAFLPHAVWLMVRYGRERLMRAIASGQYRFPQSLFYGGQQQTALQRCLTQDFLPLLGSSQCVEHFDIHTGLGAYGQLRLLMDHGLDADQYDGAVERYGAGTVSVPSIDIGYQAAGTIGRWLQQRRPGYRYFCVEVGTLHPVKVLKELRNENFAWYRYGPGSDEHATAGQRLRACFFPDDPVWLANAIRETLAIYRQALPS